MPTSVREKRRFWTRTEVPAPISVLVNSCAMAAQDSHITKPGRRDTALLAFIYPRKSLDPTRMKKAPLLAGPLLNFFDSYHTWQAFARTIGWLALHPQAFWNSGMF